MPLPNTLQLLIERSSMGAPAVRGLRERTPRDVVAAILDAAAVSSWADGCRVHNSGCHVLTPTHATTSEILQKGGDEDGAYEQQTILGQTQARHAGTRFGDLPDPERAASRLDSGAPTAPGSAWNNVQARRTCPPQGVVRSDTGASLSDVLASEWGSTVNKESHMAKRPDKDARVIGAAIGGAIGGVVGAIIAGPFGAAVGAAVASGVGHEVASEASKQGA
jgi:rubredoxin